MGISAQIEVVEQAQDKGRELAEERLGGLMHAYAMAPSDRHLLARVLALAYLEGSRDGFAEVRTILTAAGGMTPRTDAAIEEVLRRG